MMLKKSASGVLASLRGSEALEGIFRSPSSILRANGHTKCGWYLLRLFAHCGLAWDKARLDAPGLGGLRSLVFLSILPVIRHYQPTYYQWILPRKN